MGEDSQGGGWKTRGTSPPPPGASFPKVSSSPEVRWWLGNLPPGEEDKINPYTWLPAEIYFSEPARKYRQLVTLELAYTNRDTSE